MKKNNNMKQLLVAIIAVVLIIAIVGGSTFAYFQWTSNESQRTSVNVTIERNGVSMVIAPTETEFTGLYPVADCNNATAMAHSMVTITNDTNVPVIPSLKLNVKVTKGGTGTLTPEILSHIHYSVVSSDNGSEGEICSNPLTVSNDGIFDNGTQLAATGNFSTVSTTGEWSDLPSTEGVYLPRQYNNGTTTGVTFFAPARETTSYFFAVHVWIDSDYATTTIGNTITDPLQNAKIEVTWSTNSMIEQVNS